MSHLLVATPLIFLIPHHDLDLQLPHLCIENHSRIIQIYLLFHNHILLNFTPTLILLDLIPILIRLILLSILFNLYLTEILPPP